MTDELRAGWIRRLNRLQWVAISCFILGIAIPAIALPIIVEISPSNRSVNRWFPVFLLPSAILLLGSPFMLIGVIVVRDRLAGERWRFSLRSLLLWMTGIAVGLGVLMYFL